MDNIYMNFWQNTLSDMFDSSSQLKKMDIFFEKSLLNFGEFASLFQKLGNWGNFLNPADTSVFDFRNMLGDYFKTMGMVSIDEYRALVKKYEELQKNQSFDNTNDDKDSKIKELNQAIKNEKKKLSTRDKSIEKNKIEISQLKETADSLKNELSQEKKQSLSLQKELDNFKKQIETLEKKLSDKTTQPKKAETTKA